MLAHACKEVMMLLDKIKDLFSGKPRKENRRTKSTAKKGSVSSQCSHKFGYLSSFSRYILPYFPVEQPQYERRNNLIKHENPSVP